MSSLFKSLIAGTCLLASGSLFAATVSSSQIQTIDGQDFNFALNTGAYDPGTTSSLTVTVQGDFNGYGGGEQIAAIDVEGISLGNYTWNSPEAYDVTNYNYNAYEFSLDFFFDAATTASLLADQVLNIFIDFDDSVHHQYGWSGPSIGVVGEGNSPYAAVEFNYGEANLSPVPVPAAAWLFGSALLGFAGWARKKNKKA